jgi:hypothetical protein
MSNQFPAKQIAIELIEANGVYVEPVVIGEAISDWEEKNGIFLTESEQDIYFDDVQFYIDSAAVSITFTETGQGAEA